MKRLISLLRSRRGETLVEVLVSMVLFLMIMAVLSGAMGFAAKAQDRAERMLRNVEAVQANIRSGTGTENAEGRAAFEFKAISKDEQYQSKDVLFTVTVDKVELTVPGAEGFGDAILHLFKGVTP